MPRVQVVPYIRSELQQLWTSRIARIGIVAVVLIPLLYAGTYLWAFWDPAANLERVPAAIVNDDAPTRVDGTTIAVGDDLTAKLTDAQAFDWTVTSSAAATAGVADGTYYFALVIPSDFSSTIASASEPAAARQATLSLLLNDANSYIATTIASRAVAEIRTQLASEVGSREVAALLTGLGDVRVGLSAAADGAAKLSDGLAQLETGSGVMVDGVHRLADGSVAVRAGASDAAAGASQLAAGVVTLRSGATALTAGTARLADGAKALEAGASSAAVGASDLASGTRRLAGGATDLVAGAARLSASSAGLTTGTASVAGGASSVATGSRQLADTLAVLAADPNLDPTAAETLSAIAEKASAVASGADQLADSASAAAVGAGKLASGVGSLAEGTSVVRDGAAALAAGSQRLADGTASVASGAAQVADAAGKVTAGARRLASGIADASAGAQRLASGTTDLAAGAAALADGSTRLASGDRRVASGVADAATGAATLATRLVDGATAIPVVTTPDVTTPAQSIVSPVTVQTLHGTVAATYGAGLAPYFIGLALWVGAVFVFGLIRPVARRHSEGRVHALGRVVAGFVQASVVTAAQALVLLGILVIALGLTPVYPLQLAAFLVLAAIAFAALVQALNAALGGVGRVVAIAFLILQLAASGGTYPIETAPAFFRTVSPFLPMTYFVNAVRRLVSGGTLDPVPTAVIVLAAVTVGSLLVTWLVTRIGREKEGMIDFGPSKATTSLSAS